MKKQNLIMRIDALQHPEKNVRKHSRKQIDEMKRSITMFGQFSRLWLMKPIPSLLATAW